MTYTVEVGGRRLEVALPESLAAPKAVTTVRSGGSAVRRKARPSSATTASDGTVLTSPMVGTVVKVSAAEGAEVSEGDVLFVIEAMKMEQPVKAHRPGVVHAIKVSAGTGVSRGAPLCEVRTAG